MTLEVNDGVLILPKSRRKLRQTVIIVDDDTSMLRAIARLVRADGFEVLTFDRPSLLLAADIPKYNACLVLDVNLPEMDGAELYQTLTAAGCRLPVIMITGRNDSKTRRLIERVKTVGVLFKPFDDTAFLEVISRALA
jgi:FixJ family two-component response regulator